MGYTRNGCYRVKELAYGTSVDVSAARLSPATRAETAADRARQEAVREERAAERERANAEARARREAYEAECAARVPCPRCKRQALRRRGVHHQCERCEYVLGSWTGIEHRAGHTWADVNGYLSFVPKSAEQLAEDARLDAMVKVFNTSRRWARKRLDKDGARAFATWYAKGGHALPVAEDVFTSWCADNGVTIEPTVPTAPTAPTAPTVEAPAAESPESGELDRDATNAGSGEAPVPAPPADAVVADHERRRADVERRRRSPYLSGGIPRVSLAQLAAEQEQQRRAEPLPMGQRVTTGSGAPAEYRGRRGTDGFCWVLLDGDTYPVTARLSELTPVEISPEQERPADVADNEQQTPAEAKGAAEPEAAPINGELDRGASSECAGADDRPAHLTPQEVAADEVTEETADIVIRHTHEAGTVIEGSAKGDGVWEALKEQGWTYRRNPGIFIRGSRLKGGDRWKIKRGAEAVRALGLTVAVVIEETMTFAEREAARIDNAEDRAERFADRAGRAMASSEAHRETDRKLGERFYMGQPILIGHHSEGRARRDQERMHNAMRNAIAEEKRADYWTNRADAAEAYEKHRNNPGVTLRRIKKLEAERRSVLRQRDSDRDQAGKLRNPWWKEPTPEYRAELDRKIAEYDEELHHWAEVIAEAERRGFKVWGKADFTKGDFVAWRGTWYEVTRVNAQSVTVPHIHAAYDGGTAGVVGGKRVVTKAATEATRHRASTYTLAYDEVSGRMSGAEMMARLAGTWAEPAPVESGTGEAGGAEQDVEDVVEAELVEDQEQPAEAPEAGAAVVLVLDEPLASAAAEAARAVLAAPAGAADAASTTPAPAPAAPAAAPAGGGPTVVERDVERLVEIVVERVLARLGHGADPGPGTAAPTVAGAGQAVAELDQALAHTSAHGPARARPDARTRHAGGGRKRRRARSRR